MKCQVKSLDVWGNEDDGFTINQEFNAGEIDCDVNKNAALVQSLIDNGYLKDHVRYGIHVGVFNVSESCIEVHDYKTREPLYILEIEDDAK